MRKKLVSILLTGLLLSGCRMQVANRLLGVGSPVASQLSPTASAVPFPTEPPTDTPAPPPTITPSPAPDLSLVGLPSEAPGSTALDFVADLCGAVWGNGIGQLPCQQNGSSPEAGYVAMLNGDVQDLPSNLNLLLMYPPLTGSDTISGRYPDFTVQKGDRFRAVLTCQAHTFCDVEFGLEYFDENGRSSLARWSYLFTDAPILVDYSLDGIAGRTVQFNLAVRRHGYGLQAYAVWIMPHIYRPAK